MTSDNLDKALDSNANTIGNSDEINVAAARQLSKGETDCRAI